MSYSWTMTPPVSDPGLGVDAGLLADGVETATLIHDDNVIYAMSLLPADTPPVVG